MRSIKIVCVILLLVQSPVMSKVINLDLTHSFDDETVYWPTEQTLGKFKFTWRYATANKSSDEYYEANRFCTAEHGGTHFDAPRHFAYGKLGAANTPLDKLIGKLFIVDVSSEAEKNKDLLITQKHIEKAEASLNRKVDDCIVLFYTGFSKLYPNLAEYLGTNTTNTSILHFPGLQPEAATWLTKERKVKSVGIDTAAIDYGQSKTFQAHRILFSHNIPAFENVNLKEIEKVKSAKDVMIYALPMKIKGGSGAPLRIIATYDDSVDTSDGQQCTLDFIAFGVLLIATLVIN